MRGRGGQGVVVAANHPRLSTLLIWLGNCLNDNAHSQLAALFNGSKVTTNRGWAAPLFDQLLATDDRIA